MTGRRSANGRQSKIAFQRRMNNPIQWPQWRYILPCYLAATPCLVFLVHRSTTASTNGFNPMRNSKCHAGQGRMAVSLRNNMSTPTDDRNSNCLAYHHSVVRIRAVRMMRTIMICAEMPKLEDRRGGSYGWKRINSAHIWLTSRECERQRDSLEVPAACRWLPLDRIVRFRRIRCTISTRAKLDAYGI